MTSPILTIQVTPENHTQVLEIRKEVREVINRLETSLHNLWNGEANAMYLALGAWLDSIVSGLQDEYIKAVGAHKCTRHITVTHNNKPFYRYMNGSSTFFDYMTACSGKLLEELEWFERALALAAMNAELRPTIKFVDAGASYMEPSVVARGRFLEALSTLNDKRDAVETAIKDAYTSTDNSINIELLDL